MLTLLCLFGWITLFLSAFSSITKHEIPSTYKNNKNTISKGLKECPTRSVATGEYKNQIPFEQMIPVEYIHISALYWKAKCLIMSVEQLKHELNELLNQRFGRNCYDKYEYSTLIEFCKNELKKITAATKKLIVCSQ